jgi:AcrR family transcriptional regulator
MPRPDVSEERRHQILDAALQIFARRGIYQSRMDDIVKEAGLSKGAIYWYFKSKDELVTALMERLMDRSRQDLDLLSYAEQPVPQRIAQLADSLAEQVAQFAHLQSIVFEFYALAARSSEMRQFFQRYYSEYGVALAGLIEQGIARGELRPVDPASAARSLIGLFEGIALLWALDPQLDGRRQIAEATALILDGLAL